MGIAKDVKYWNDRYSSGGHSGYGSLGNLLNYKADVINDLIKELGAKSIIDVGCGDGNLGSLLKCEDYTGFDVSDEAVFIAQKKRDGEFTSELPDKVFDLAISIDIVFHITNEADLLAHLNYLRKHKNFIIYASLKVEAPEIHENGFDWSSMLNKEPIKTIPQKFPVEEFGVLNGSFSEWFIY